jgi:hypothetical protein
MSELSYRQLQEHDNYTIYSFSITQKPSESIFNYCPLPQKGWNNYNYAVDIPDNGRKWLQYRQLFHFQIDEGNDIYLQHFEYSKSQSYSSAFASTSQKIWMNYISDTGKCFPVWISPWILSETSNIIFNLLSYYIEAHSLKTDSTYNVSNHPDIDIVFSVI